MTTCCLSSLISSDHVSHVSNYAATLRMNCPLNFYLKPLLPPAVMSRYCLQGVCPFAMAMKEVKENHSGVSACFVFVFIYLFDG